MIPKLPKLTGNLLRAGRALAGFTRDDLADRAGLSRDVLRSWEVSSAAIVPAQYQMHCRAIEALEGEGARFSGDGVSILSGDSPLSNGSGTSRHQLRMIARFTSRYGFDCSGPSRRRIDLRMSYDGAPPGCFSGR